MFGFAPNGSRPIAALPSWSVHVHALADIDAEDSQFNTLYAATRPFVTYASDTPPNQVFEGTLEATLRVDRSVISGDGYGGFAINIAEFGIINAHGLYDDTVDESSINGQPITFSVGEVVDGEVVPYVEFVTLAELIGERWRVNRSRLTIETHDLAAKLDVPVQTSVYLGTGDLEGDAELAGKHIPMGWGTVFNCTPQLVIGVEGLWQCSDGAVTSIDAVKNGGVELDLVADYATVALLRAANTALAIPAGFYGTCIAEGYFCVGGTTFKQITCDFTALNSTTADIIEEVALGSAGLSSADLDAWTFAELNAAQPAARSYYLDSGSTETCRQMFDRLMRGIHGFAGVTTLGQLQVRRIEPPVEIASQYYDLNGGNLIDIDRTDLPAGIDPPPRRQRVTYAHNWTEQTELYGQVSEDDPALADYLGKPYKIASTSEAQEQAILADYPYAPDPEPVEGFFVLEADALAHAEFLDEFYTSGLKPYRCTFKHALFQHQICEVVNVADTSINPRLSLGTGKYLRLLEINDDTNGRVTEAIGLGY